MEKMQFGPSLEGSTGINEEVRGVYEPMCRDGLHGVGCPEMSMREEEERE